MNENIQKRGRERVRKASPLHQGSSRKGKVLHDHDLRGSEERRENNKKKLKTQAAEQLPKIHDGR